MNPEHAKLLAEIRGAARPTSPERHGNDSFGGSERPFYFASVPARRAIARRWLAANRAMAPKTFLAVVESLFNGESHEEKTMASLLLGYHGGARQDVRPADVERWLGLLNGWAEVDSLCQSVFTAPEMANGWPDWRRLIERLSQDANINKRRAALVLLTGPVQHTDDPRFRDLALTMLERLKAEWPILITKAVSWLLRAMVARHRGAVIAYLAEHGPSLPAIAVRETRTKLATGVKSGRPRA
jgi:3-methyladenine DNA glycosylase AlkD